ncbi:MAG: P-loop NTPase, partial [Actinomycetota bacterium]|nr:P-loop NTPase [Actinomycetota bacterium]
ENMSGSTFGSGGGTDLANQLGVPQVGTVPLDPAVVTGGDEGRPVVTEEVLSPAAISYLSIAERVVQLVPPADLETCTGRIAKLIANLEHGAA